MDQQKVKQLVKKYLEAETTAEEERQLQAYFKKEVVPEELQAYADQFRYNEEIKKTEPAAGFDPLDKINFSEKENVAAASMPSIKSRVVFDPDPHSNANQFTRWSLRIAAGFILLLIGFAAGQLLTNESDYASNEQVAKLQEEVQQMKSALMNTGSYHPASAGERLSAVNISTRIPAKNNKLDQQITDILIYTLNNDESVNVRLAAAEALFRFRNEPLIKKALTASLNNQDDPFMQITLIDMLVELKAADAINNMQKLLVDTDTQEIVRDRLKTGIAQLKA